MHPSVSGAGNTMIFPHVQITGERSIRFAFGSEVGKETFHLVQQFCEMVQTESSFYMEEVVPSYHTVTVYLKKDLVDKGPFIQTLLAKWEGYFTEELVHKPRTLRIPVCYGGEFGMDMARVMSHTGLPTNEIITLHSQPLYTVYMMGFLPGFPYLGGLNEKLTTPRLAEPRLKVPKGTVGIGGSQTGIYPLDCPGGWNIIGRTPLDIYDPKREEPFLIRAGDQLQFDPISYERFFELKAELGEYPKLMKEFVEDPV